MVTSLQVQVLPSYTTVDFQVHPSTPAQELAKDDVIHFLPDRRDMDLATPFPPRFHLLTFHLLSPLDGLFHNTHKAWIWVSVPVRDMDMDL